MLYMRVSRKIIVNVVLKGVNKQFIPPVSCQWKCNKKSESSQKVFMMRMPKNILLAVCKST